MKHTLYILQYAKGTCQAEAMSNGEKIKPVEGIRQDVSQSVENYVISKEALQIVLKALSDLVIPNQYCQGAITVLCEAGFR